jgi:hypothetical protein
MSSKKRDEALLAVWERGQYLPWGTAFMEY